MCFRKPDITNLTKYLSNGRTAWLWIVDPGWLTLFSTNDVLWNRLPTLAEAELIFWQNLVRNNWIYCVVSDNNDVVTWTAFRCSTSHDLWWVFESNLTHFVDTCFQWEVIVCALLGFFFSCSTVKLHRVRRQLRHSAHFFHLRKWLVKRVDKAV